MVSTSCHSLLYFCHIPSYRSLKNVFLAFLFWEVHPVALALNPRGKRFLKQKCWADETTLSVRALCSSALLWYLQEPEVPHNCNWTYVSLHMIFFCLFVFEVKYVIVLLNHWFSLMILCRYNDTFIIPVECVSVAKIIPDHEAWQSS